VWLLNDLYVAEHARRIGAGRALLQAAASVAAAQGVVRLDLVTAVDNAAAQALYASMGWQRDVVFQRYQLALN
jgi:ribosomal protein S18 acetylase RimI-like enzyme